MDANVNNPALPTLTNSFVFTLKKSSTDSYPITKSTNPNSSYIYNLRLSTKSGNSIFSNDGSTYVDTITSTNENVGVNYIRLTQDEEIVATVLDNTAVSRIFLANYTNTLAIEGSLSDLMYCEVIGLPSGAGSKVSGTELDLWNPNLETFNTAYDSFEHTLNVSDYILFNNGKLSVWFANTDKITFDLKKLDDNSLFNGKTLLNLVSFDRPQMIYTGRPTDTITWKCNMFYFTFKDVLSAKNWFLALANSPDAIAGLKNVRLAASGFVWDEDCLEAKSVIINQLTQAYINSCTYFTVFGQNWKQ